MRSSTEPATPWQSAALPAGHKEAALNLNCSRTTYVIPRRSRYLVIKDLELEDHGYYGCWDLIP